MENAYEYSQAIEEALDDIDFRSILYVTKPEDKQYADNMIIDMTLCEFEESKKHNIKNKKLVVLCEEEKQSFWREKFKEFENQLEIFCNFNILSMTLLNYLTNKNQYTVILDMDLSDAIAFQGLNCIQAFLQIPFVANDRIAYHLWCSAENVGMIISMFDDLTPTKLIYKNCYEDEEVQAIFGKDETLSEPTDFTLFNRDKSVGCGLITENYVDYRKPLGG